MFYCYTHAAFYNFYQIVGISMLGIILYIGIIFSEENQIVFNNKTL